MLWTLSLGDKGDGDTRNNNSQIEHPLGTDHSDERAIRNSEINYNMTRKHHFLAYKVHLIISFNLPKYPEAVIILR